MLAARRLRGNHGGRQQMILHVGHPQVASLRAVVEQPDGAGVASGSFHHRLRQSHRKIRRDPAPDEKVERKLDDVGLHLRQALRAPHDRWPHE
jgi:hypothetical protein